MDKKSAEHEKLEVRLSLMRTALTEVTKQRDEFEHDLNTNCRINVDHDLGMAVEQSRTRELKGQCEGMRAGIKEKADRISELERERNAAERGRIIATELLGGIEDIVSDAYEKAADRACLDDCCAPSEMLLEELRRDTRLSAYLKPETTNDN